MILDNGNIISLIALEVGVLGAFFGLLVHYINNYVLGRVKQMEETAASMKNEDFFLSGIAENAVRLFILQDAVIMSHHLLLVRMLKTAGIDEAGIKAYRDQFRSSRRRTNKTMQTLMIYSSRKEWRQSAFKQLSEDFGGADTLCALLELKQYEKELTGDLKRAISDLQTRLDEVARRNAENPDATQPSS